MIRHNWKYKLLALFVALILWTYVNSERNPQSHQTFTVPLRAVNVARGYTPDLGLSKVSVNIDGLKTAVDAVAKEDIEAQVDMSKLRPRGKIIGANLAVEILLPRALENNLDVTVTPKSVPVQMEALERRQIPVEANFTSEPPAGYSYSNPLLTPNSVTISGRVTQLEKVSKVIITLPDDASDSTTNDYYDVSPIDSGGNVVTGINVRPSKVLAKLEMVEVAATKAVIVSPVFSGQPKFPARVLKYSVSPTSVTLEGKPSTLSEISVISTEKVSLEGVSANIIRDVDLKVPSGARIVGAKSVRVLVYIGSD